MGAGATRKLGVPSAAAAEPSPVAAVGVPDGCGAHPTSEAPATAAVARPPILKRLRRLMEPAVALGMVWLFMGTLL